jgi:hypothetical protein
METTETYLGKKVKEKNHLVNLGGKKLNKKLKNYENTKRNSNKSKSLCRIYW